MAIFSAYKLQSQRVGDPPYHYTLALLRKLGVDSKKIHWVPAGAPPARAAALRNDPRILRHDG